MAAFNPISALAGGALIGLASAWLLVANGRIAGVSGILHGIVVRAAGDGAWRAWFVAGLFAAGLAWHALGLAPAPRTGFGLGWAAAGGLLVGFGTRLSSGCTSGHGICGLARLSLRSLVAVATFMAFGVLATYLSRHVLGVGA
ncbi:MAG: YeeE/YedE family protein [Burkholderiales bacterium]